MPSPPYPYLDTSQPLPLTFSFSTSPCSPTSPSTSHFPSYLSPPLSSYSSLWSSLYSYLFSPLYSSSFSSSSPYPSPSSPCNSIYFSSSTSSTAHLFFQFIPQCCLYLYLTQIVQCITFWIPIFYVSLLWYYGIVSKITTNGEMVKWCNKKHFFICMVILWNQYGAMMQIIHTSSHGEMVKHSGEIVKWWDGEMA